MKQVVGSVLTSHKTPGLFVTLRESGERGTLSVQAAAVSGMAVRRIGLTPPWEDEAAWSSALRQLRRSTRCLGLKGLTLNTPNC
jgi:hypothetical protein